MGFPRRLLARVLATCMERGQMTRWRVGGARGLPHFELPGRKAQRRV